MEGQQTRNEYRENNPIRKWQKKRNKMTQSGDHLLRVQ